MQDEANSLVEFTMFVMPAWSTGYSAGFPTSTWQAYNYYPAGAMSAGDNPNTWCQKSYSSSDWVQTSEWTINASFLDGVQNRLLIDVSRPLQVADAQQVTLEPESSYKMQINWAVLPTICVPELDCPDWINEEFMPTSYIQGNAFAATLPNSVAILQSGRMLAVAATASVLTLISVF